MAPEVLAVLIAAAMASAYAVVSAGAMRQRRMQAWRVVAKRRGGSLDEARDVLSIPAGDARIEVTIERGETRVQGHYPVPAGLQFALYSRSGKLGPTLDQRAYPRNRVGLPRLDDRFVFRTR